MRRTHARADRASSPGSAERPAGSAVRASAPTSPAPQANERFRLLFDRASVGIISVDRDGRAVEANPAVERMLGYGPGEILGVSFTTFTHPDDVGVSKENYRGWSRTVARRTSMRSVTSAGTGEVIWCRVNVWTDAGAPDSDQVAIAMIEDVTQAKLAELALQEKATRLERIISTQRDIAAAASGDLEQVMQVIVERAQALTRAEGAMIHLIEGEDVVTRAASGIAVRFLHNRRPLNQSISRFAIAAREPLLIEYAENDPRLNAQLQSWSATAPTSACRCLPATGRSARSAS